MGKPSSNLQNATKLEQVERKICIYNRNPYILTSAITTSTTAEDICILVAKQLGIGPMTVSLFGLVNEDHKVWLNLNKNMLTFDFSKNIFFRMRLKLPNDEQMSSRKILGDKTLEYLFDQCRDDFLNDRLKTVYGMSEIPEKIVLGIGVFNMLVHIRQDGLPVTDISKRYKMKDFLPKSVYDKFHMPWNEFRLKRNILPKLQKLDNDFCEESLIKLKQLYVKQILKECPKYGTETYTIGGCTYSIDPYDINYPGLLLNKDIHLGTINDLFGISVTEPEIGFTGNGRQERWSVHIDFLGRRPNIIEFEDRAVMESFVSALDAYYRLSIDFYYGLCRHVQPPSCREMIREKHFGPITKECAVKILTDSYKRQPGYYIIKKNVEAFDHGFIVVCFVHVEGSPVAHSYAIDITDDKQYQMRLTGENEPLFSTLRDLLCYYESNKKITKQVNMAKMEVTNLLLCRDSSRNSARTEEPSSNEVQPINRPVCYIGSELTITPRSRVQGSFTEIMKGTLMAGGMERKVIIKRLRRLPALSENLDIDFHKTINHHMFLKNCNFVKLYGVCFEPQLCAVWEETEGSLSAYLRDPDTSLSFNKLRSIAEQVAHGLMYMEKERLIHGNIRCRNIMVMTKSYEVNVKISDCGLVSLYSRLAIESGPNTERLPWLAPELLHPANYQATIESDVYAFGVTMWEIFSFGQRPWAELNVHEMKQAIERGDRLPQPNILITKAENNNVERKSQSNQDKSNDVPNSASDGQTESAASHHDAFEARIADVDDTKIADSEVARENVDLNGIEGDIFDAAFSVNTATSVNITDSRTDVVKLIENCRQLDWKSRRAPTDIVKLLREIGWKSCDDSHLANEYNFVERGSFFNGNEEMVSLESLGLNFESEIFPEDITIQKQLGKGNFGIVHEALLHKNGKVAKVAVKKLLTSGVDVDKLEDDLRRESSMLQTVQHQNIIRFVGMCQKAHLMLVMELAENGSLQSYLVGYRTQGQGLAPAAQLTFCLQISQGMMKLADMNVVHRDLATRNILLDQNKVAKITDFGLARVLSNEKDYYTMRKGGDIPANWYAPECLGENKFSKESDVWSFGVLMWEIYSYAMPPKLITSEQAKVTAKDLLQLFQNGKRLDKPGSCPGEIYTKIMEKCWKYKPTDRLIIAEVAFEISNLLCYGSNA